jgi:hypothetical protein
LFWGVRGGGHIHLARNNFFMYTIILVEREHAFVCPFCREMKKQSGSEDQHFFTCTFWIYILFYFIACLGKQPERQQYLWKMLQYLNKKNMCLFCFFLAFLCNLKIHKFKIKKLKKKLTGKKNTTFGNFCTKCCCSPPLHKFFWS